MSFKEVGLLTLLTACLIVALGQHTLPMIVTNHKVEVLAFPSVEDQQKMEECVAKYRPFSVDSSVEIQATSPNSLGDSLYRKYVQRSANFKNLMLHNEGNLTEQQILNGECR